MFQVEHWAITGERQDSCSLEAYDLRWKNNANLYTTLENHFLKVLKFQTCVAETKSAIMVHWKEWLSQVQSSKGWLWKNEEDWAKQVSIGSNSGSNAFYLEGFCIRELPEVVSHFLPLTVPTWAPGLQRRERRGSIVGCHCSLAHAKVKPSKREQIPVRRNSTGCLLKIWKTEEEREISVNPVLVEVKLEFLLACESSAERKRKEGRNWSKRCEHRHCYKT